VSAQEADRPEPAALLASADVLVAAARRARTADGEWTPALNLGHLSQVDDEVWAPRIEQMVEARHRSLAAPSFSWWESAEGTTESRFADHSLDAAAAELLRSRRELVARLVALSDDDWTAIAHHDVFGVIDVVGLVREVLAHDHVHLELLGAPDGGTGGPQ
jgi:hypothetical protein